MKNGLTFNIQKFCINDGPGIRTIVFLKGCPLHCKWCHNPESHFCKTELLYDADKCVGCGRCGALCPQSAHTFEDAHRINRDKCVFAGRVQMDAAIMLLNSPVKRCRFKK